jgi:nucleoside-diphosphate kinase
MKTRTLLLFKPDLCGSAREGEAVMDLLVRAEFEVVWERRRMMVDQAWVKAFYFEHVGRPYFEAHAEFLTSGPMRAFEFEHAHQDAISLMREWLGHADPAQGQPGQLRRKYGTGLPCNAFHASDSLEAFRRERLLVFGDGVRP